MTDNKKIKVVALFGKAGAGKDRLLKELLGKNSNFHEIISCTTRPPREGEVDGVNYHFLSSEAFQKKLGNGDMLEVAIFRGWCYGTMLSALDENKINIGVFNPTGIENITTYDFLDVLPIKVGAAAKTRLLRQLNREQNPDVDEIIRRYGTDEEDFNDLFNFWNHPYKTVDNNEGRNIQEVANSALKEINSYYDLH